MHLTLEKRIIAAIIALASVAIAIVFFIIWPTINHIKEMDKTTEDLRLYLEKKYERSLNVRATLKQVDAIKAEMVNAPKYLFHTGDDLRLMVALESVAKKNNVEQNVANSNLNNPATQNILIALTVTGEYDNVLKYLADLENMPYFFSVNHLVFSPTVQTGSDPKIPLFTMNLDISLYVSP